MFTSRSVQRATRWGGGHPRSLRIRVDHRRRDFLLAASCSGIVARHSRSVVPNGSIPLCRAGFMTARITTRLASSAFRDCGRRAASWRAATSRRGRDVVGVIRLAATYRPVLIRGGLEQGRGEAWTYVRRLGSRDASLRGHRKLRSKCGAGNVGGGGTP